MFKKSDIPGDKTHKHEVKDDTSKAANRTEESAPSAEKTAAPANEVKKS